MCISQIICLDHKFTMKVLRLTTATEMQNIDKHIIEQ